jgi:type II secretory pathway pseudopilin PulG
MSSNKQFQQLSAFTLIELLVTASLTVLVMMGMTSLFISFIVSAGKARLSQSIRENGSSAMQKMIEELRNAKSITSTCDGSPSSTLEFTNADEVTSTFSNIDDKIALVSDANTYFLSSSPGTGSNQLRDLEFTCHNIDSGARYVEISFTLASSAASDPSASHSQLDFSSGVSLRN